jgi:heat shock protein HslJ
MQLRRAFVLPVMVLVLSGCRLFGLGGGGPADPVASPSASPAPSSNDLQGAWVLTAGWGPSGALSVPDGGRITLNIEGSEAGGTAACNLYGGTIAQDGSHVSFSAMSMTEMACEEPLMAAEAAYLGALALITDASRDGDQLILTGEGAELTFELLPPVPDEEMVGTTWVLNTITTGDVASSVLGEPMLQLSADGTLTGSTGCRELVGRYVIYGDEVVVTDLEAIGQCSDELSGQDGQVISVLEGGFTVAVDGASLTIGSGAEGLVYHAAE